MGAAYTEDDLKLLLNFVNPYFHTYPYVKGHLHAMLCELERQGKVRRHLNKPGHVCWIKVYAQADQR